jgi:glycosyltransferase involved in cell wall biosynthesis
VKISAVIIAGNEEAKIGDAVCSVQWADEILVVDSESTDRTRDIARENGARVLIRAWQGFSSQKQFGVDTAAHDWIFSLDADERVSPALSDEIAVIRSTGPLADGYRIPRLTSYMGRPIRHSGWYPDHQLRLFDRRRGRWSESLIHESIVMSEGARVETLREHILHFTIDSAAEHHRMIGERYAPLAARQMLESGRRTSPLTIATAGYVSFLSHYVLKRGFMDGLAGFCIARFAAHHAYLKHLLLWELQNEDRRNERRS